MSSNDATFILPDGRKLGFIEYGDPHGFPIFAFHGTPGSRIWFKEDDDTSKAMGVRLVAVDRPGFGNSDQKQGRTFIEFADDVLELSKHLNLDRFSVMGVSGGGAYAAACSYKYPDHIHKAGLISTVDQFENGKTPKEMALANRITFYLARRWPWPLKYFLKQQKSIIDKQPKKYVESFSKHTKHLCDSDRGIMVMEDTAQVMLIHMKEAFKNGIDSVVQEMKMFGQEWGFDCTQITTPVELWHGTHDTLAPIKLGRSLARKIPNCHENYVEGKGHFLTEEEDIWKQILLSLKA